MISRHWKGTAKPGLAVRYISHLQQETFPQLAALPGFVRASILRREVAAREARILAVARAPDCTAEKLVAVFKELDDIH